MKIGIRQFGVSLLLVLGMAQAVAGPDAMKPSGSAAVRSYRMQSISMERVDQRIEQQMPGQEERRSAGDFNAPQMNGYVNHSEGFQGNPSENARRQGRMSLEERRALRRQIDEAVHDINRSRR